MIQWCQQTGKVCHVTPKQARIALRSALRRVPKQDKNRTVYLCRKCNFWHFGLDSKKRKRFHLAGLRR